MTQLLKSLASIVCDCFPEAGSGSGTDSECYYIWEVGHNILTSVNVYDETGRQRAVVFIGFVCCQKGKLERFWLTVLNCVW